MASPLASVPRDRVRALSESSLFDKRHSTGGEVAVLQGYLKKASRHRLKGWRKLWFVLKGNCLFYYKSRDEYYSRSKHKGCIELDQIVMVRDSPNRPALGFEIEALGKRKLHLLAETIEEKARWVDVIQVKPMDEKRVTVFRNGAREGGKVVMVSAKWEEFLAVLSEKMGFPAQRIFNKDGGEIDEVDLIAANDVLYVSEGDPFRRPSMENTDRDAQLALFRAMMKDMDPSEMAEQFSSDDQLFKRYNTIARLGGGVGEATHAGAHARRHGAREEAHRVNSLPGAFVPPRAPAESPPSSSREASGSESDEDKSGGASVPARVRPELSLKIPNGAALRGARKKDVVEEEEVLPFHPTMSFTFPKGESGKGESTKTETEPSDDPETPSSAGRKAVPVPSLNLLGLGGGPPSPKLKDTVLPIPSGPVEEERIQTHNVALRETEIQETSTTSPFAKMAARLHSVSPPLDYVRPRRADSPEGATPPRRSLFEKTLPQEPPEHKGSAGKRKTAILEFQEVRTVVEESVPHEFVNDEEVLGIEESHAFGPVAGSEGSKNESTLEPSPPKSPSGQVTDLLATLKRAKERRREEQERRKDEQERRARSREASMSSDPTFESVEVEDDGTHLDGVRIPTFEEEQELRDAEEQRLLKVLEESPFRFQRPPPKTRSAERPPCVQPPVLTEGLEDHSPVDPDGLESIAEIEDYTEWRDDLRDDNTKFFDAEWIEKNSENIGDVWLEVTQDDFFDDLEKWAMLGTQSDGKLFMKLGLKRRTLYLSVYSAEDIQRMEKKLLADGTHEINKIDDPDEDWYMKMGWIVKYETITGIEVAVKASCSDVAEVWRVWMVFAPNPIKRAADLISCPEDPISVSRASRFNAPPPIIIDGPSLVAEDFKTMMERKHEYKSKGTSNVRIKTSKPCKATLVECTPPDPYYIMNMFETVMVLVNTADDACTIESASALFFLDWEWVKSLQTTVRVCDTQTGLPFVIPPGETRTVVVECGLKVEGNLAEVGPNRNRLHPTLPEPMTIWVTFEDHINRNCMLTMDYFNPPSRVLTKEDCDEEIARNGFFNQSKVKCVYFLSCDDVEICERYWITILAWKSEPAKALHHKYPAELQGNRPRFAIYSNEYIAYFYDRDLRKLVYEAVQEGTPEIEVEGNLPYADVLSTWALVDLERKYVYGLRFVMETETSFVEDHFLMSRLADWAS